MPGDSWTLAAAWVQAVGSLAAIGIAIWVPFELDRRARVKRMADEAARARLVQASLLPTLYRIRSTTADFLDEQSGNPSFLGVERKPADFDSDFFRLTPEFTGLLQVAIDSGKVKEDIAELSVMLFKTAEMLSENSKLQRDGYHAAWINHKDLFIEAATEINDLSEKIITAIEASYPERTP